MKDFLAMLKMEKRWILACVSIIAIVSITALTIHLVVAAGSDFVISTMNGESVVNGASILERGYEDFVEKVKKLGGEIKKG